MNAALHLIERELGQKEEHLKQTILKRDATAKEYHRLKDTAVALEADISELRAAFVGLNGPTQEPASPDPEIPS